MNTSVSGTSEVGTAVATRFNSLGHAASTKKLGHVWFNLVAVRKDG